MAVDQPTQPSLRPAAPAATPRSHGVRQGLRAGVGGRAGMPQARRAKPPVIAGGEPRSPTSSRLIASSSSASRPGLRGRVVLPVLGKVTATKYTDRDAVRHVLPLLPAGRDFTRTGIVLRRPLRSSSG
jgi:hypothetical protein